MKSIKKYLYGAVLLLTVSLNAKSQSIHVTDLIRLAKASHADATNYITTKLHFSLVSSGNVNGMVMSKYAKSDGKLVESVIKMQSSDADKNVHGIIDYSIKPKTAAEAIIKELEKAKFKASRKIHDKTKDDRLYENAECTVSVYVFADKRFPAAIELRIK